MKRSISRGTAEESFCASTRAPGMTCCFLRSGGRANGIFCGADAPLLGGPVEPDHDKEGCAASGMTVRAVEGDLLRECLRRGLPKPEIEIKEITVGPKGGNVFAKARLRFAVAVSGPVLLGFGSHAGDGLFAAVAD